MDRWRRYLNLCPGGAGDDHATHAISACGSRINITPNIDRIAQEGAVFDNSFCTNSICAPSRAVVLTGKYSHLNGKPFMVMCQHKAPHRQWMPGPDHLTMYEGTEIPEPETLFDDYSNRASPASNQEMSIMRRHSWMQPGQVFLRIYRVSLWCP